LILGETHRGLDVCVDIFRRELAQPEPGLFLVGMKSYGRAPSFLAMTGYEQVRSVVAAIDVAVAALG
jgi:hypothetical protein